MASEGNTYGPTDHRRCYELYRDSRNLKAVQEETGINYSTLHRWKGAEFKGCQCPWHNWDTLLEETDKGENARLSLNPIQSLDPISVDQSVRGEEVTDNRSLLTRSDIERLSLLEFLWSKYYYEVTGIVLSAAMLVEASSAGGEVSEVQREAYLKRGLRSKNSESATRTLLAIGKEIDELKERLGLSSAAKSGDVSTRDTEEEKPLTFEELRAMQAKLRNTSPEQMAVMRDLLRSESAMEVVNRATG